MKGHTTARIGKRIKVILKTGVAFVDKLQEDKSKYFIFERYGRVEKGTIRSFSINKRSEQ